MPSLRPHPEQKGSTDSVPGLTRQPSVESVGSPSTPSVDNITHQPSDKNLKIKVDAQKSQAAEGYPFPTPMSAPATTGEFPNSPKSPQVPSKDLPFLAHDPYADDDIIPFDKNKPIVPARSGSIRSIMSTNSMQSLKRGFGSLKRKLTGRSKSRRRPIRQMTDGGAPTQTQQEFAADGITPIHRAQTYMMGPSMKGPQRVETFQVSAMAF